MIKQGVPFMRRGRQKEVQVLEEGHWAWDLARYQVYPESKWKHSLEIREGEAESQQVSTISTGLTTPLHPPPPQIWDFLPNLPNHEHLVTRVQLVMNVAWLPGAGAQRPQSLMAWDGNWSGVRTLSLGGLLPIPLLLVCLGTGTLTSPLLLQECHAKHEPTHPHLQTLQGVMVNLGVQNSCWGTTLLPFLL